MEDQPEGVAPKLVTIAEFDNQAEFLLARTRLESAAIECFAQERDLLHFGWRSHSGGIRLQVREADVAEALALVHTSSVHAGSGHASAVQASSVQARSVQASTVHKNSMPADSPAISQSSAELFPSEFRSGGVMRHIILGIVLTLLVLLIVGSGFALLGLLPTRGNVTPPKWEAHLAMSALDNSVDRHAAHVNNPVPPTDDNLIEGMKIYTMNCALCHGGIDRQPSQLEKSLYPPPPNLILEPDDDPEWHIFYVIHNGVRYTGMPAWDKSLSDTDMWKLTAFLSRIEKLPPAVQEYWKKAGGAAPVAEGDEHGAEHGGMEHHDHH